MKARKEKTISGVASPKLGGGVKRFDFRRITLFCLEKRLSKHKMTIFSKNLGGPWPLWPPWLRLWRLSLTILHQVPKPRQDHLSR